MAGGKWIKDLTAATPLADAARRVLAVRTAAVRDYIRPAVEQSEKNAEYVHQLRVATRRTNAALGIFSICLPPKILKLTKRTLRRYRRAAGGARDWDVFLEWLSKETKKSAKQDAQPGLDCLIGYAVAQRLEAQEAMREAISDFFAFDRLQIKLLGAVRAPESDEKVLVDLARTTLRRLLHDFDQAGHKNREDYQLLHEVRIIGKELRYAMEVFAECFPPQFREVHYAAVEEMQEILGRANDSHVAIDRLTQLISMISSRIPKQWGRFKADFNRLLKFHEERLPAERANFEKWWLKWQQEATGNSGLLRLLSDFVD